MYENVLNVKSAVRVLDILEYLSLREAPVALRDVVRDLGFPKSSIFNLLRSLVARGYVVKDETDRYVINEAFRKGFSWIGGFEARLIAFAHESMERVRERTGETVFLAVRAPSGDVRVLTKLVSKHEIRYDADRFSTIPAYGTVMGRVLLAYSGEAAIDEYFSRTEIRAFTPHTVTDVARLRKILREIRRQGYAVIKEEYALGGCGIAAPIFDQNGEVVAVIDVATIAQRFSGSRNIMVAAVVEAGAEISRRLGYRMARSA